MLAFKDLVENRPIGFLCHGHSLKLLDDNIEDFSCLDFVWGSLNNYKIAQKVIDKIGKRFDFLVNYCDAYDIKDSDASVILRNGKDRGFATCSLQEFLYECMDLGIKNRIYIFGADGFTRENETYYDGSVDKLSQGRHEKDTRVFNKTFKYNKEDYNFYNCNPESNYNVLPRIGVEECLKSEYSRAFITKE